MVKKERTLEVLWRKGNTTRYWLRKKDGYGDEIQLGKYRGLDSFDKAMKLKPTWHGKWYVDILNKKVKLFNTNTQAKSYFKKYVSKYGRK